MLAPIRWAKTLLEGARLVAEDIRAIKANDPAARSNFEVALVYPGLHALFMHRVAHQLRVGTVWVNSYRAVGPMAPFGTGSGRASRSTRRRASGGGW